MWHLFGLPSQHASQESPDTPSEHFSASSHCHTSQDGDVLASRVETASQGPWLALSKQHNCHTCCEGIEQHRPSRRHPRHAPHTRPTVCSYGQTQVTGGSKTTWFGARTAGRANLDFHMNCAFWSLLGTKSFCNFNAQTHGAKNKKQCESASLRTGRAWQPRLHHCI